MFTYTMNYPFDLHFNSEVSVRQLVLTSPLRSQNVLLLALNISQLLSSVFMIYWSLGLLRKLKALAVRSSTEEASQDKTILPFGRDQLKFFHASFIVTREAAASSFTETLLRRRPLKARFYFRLGGYTIGFLQPLLFYFNLHRNGLISTAEHYFITLSLVLAIDDTFFTFFPESNYDLFALFLKEHQRFIFNLAVEFLGLLCIFTLLMTELFAYFDPFSSLTNSFVTLVGIMFGDGLRDCFEQVSERGLAVWLVFLFSFLFFMGYMPVFFNIIAIGLQETKFALVQAHGERKKQKMLFRNISLENDGTFQNRRKMRAHWRKQFHAACEEQLRQYDIGEIAACEEENLIEIQEPKTPLATMYSVFCEETKLSKARLSPRQKRFTIDAYLPKPSPVLSVNPATLEVVDVLLDICIDTDNSHGVFRDISVRLKSFQDQRMLRNYVAIGVGEVVEKFCESLESVQKQLSDLVEKQI